MAIQQGDKLPDTTVHVMKDGRPSPTSIHALTSGKKIVIFAVPGAFTPTCSMQHLPGFIRLQGEIKAKGVDDILCLSVNDAFVMDAWGKDRQAEGIIMVADGNGDFANEIGLQMDGSGFGLGNRAQRFAMIVDDGVVSTLAVEAPGAFEVSKAEAILEAL